MLSFPQVVIGDELIGGFRETYEADRSGRLRELLAASRALRDRRLIHDAAHRRRPTLGQVGDHGRLVRLVLDLFGCHQLIWESIAQTVEGPFPDSSDTSVTVGAS
jgi:hypothetical protein